MKVNVREAFKINRDKMMLEKIESWEQKFDKQKKGKHKRI
jgi:hypothetical protein